MLFASITFIFFFLPVVLLIYWTLKNTRSQNIFLLFASVFFYIWGEAWQISVLILSVLSSYYCALKVQEAASTKKKAILLAGVGFNLVLLIAFKYSNFLIEGINRILQINLPLTNLHLPLGISFFVFHAISYVTDVYRNKVKAEKNIGVVSLYFFFFPHQIAGPIVRYEHFAVNVHDRSTKAKDLYIGIERFIQGLAKKVLIANSVAKSSDAIFSLQGDDLSFPLAWLGALCYTIQIYFDFSGYSDMAIGLARVFGFRFHENFNYPYASRSITDFWRRWHISLSSWFRDYLYIPLGGNRGSELRTYLNLAIVFLLCGLWHGANFTFIIWGLWHGTFLIVERLGIEKKLTEHKVLSHMWTLLLVILGWVIFRADSAEYSFFFIKRMFSFAHIDGESLVMVIDSIGVLGVYLGVLLSTGQIYHFFKRKLNVVPGCYEVFLLLIFALSMIRLSVSTFNPFIYFRF